MELPPDAARLPKLPFLIGDLALLSVAAYLTYSAGSPPSNAAILGIVVCAGLGVALGAAPFIVDYARQQDEQLSERQRALETLVRTTSSAADQASIAANGLHEIAEITKRNLHAIESLPGQIDAARESAQKKSTTLDTTALTSLAAAIKDLRQDLAQREPAATAAPADLQPVLDRLAALEEKLAAGLDALRDELTALPDTLAAAAPPAATVPIVASPDVAPDATPDAPTPPLADAAEPPPPTETQPSKPKAKARKTKSTPKPAPEPSLFDGDSDDEAAAVEAPSRPSPPPRPADTEPEPDAEPESAADEPSSDDSDADAQTDDIVPESPLDEPSPSEESLSTDGKTRLTVTAYIGIGNRLFVRGHGPGLSPDEGTPLQFVSIGKWRWETDAATEPVKVTLWKNDQDECTALGEVTIKPGAHLETAANF